MSAERCLEYARYAGVPDSKARELCADPNTQRCTSALLRTLDGRPLRNLDALDRWAGDLLACYAPGPRERRT
jgi:hypothetical protein